MKVKVGDKVRVIAGSDKGKEGKILRTISKENRVVVEGVNIIKRHVKPNGQGEVGGIKEYEGPIHVSNVKLVDSIKKEKKTTKAKTTKKETVKKETKKEEVKEEKKSSKKAQKED